MNDHDSILARIGGLHKYDRVVNTLTRYQAWYDSMTEEEKKSETGVWVKDKIRICDEIINKHL